MTSLKETNWTQAYAILQSRMSTSPPNSTWLLDISFTGMILIVLLLSLYLMRQCFSGLTNLRGKQTVDAHSFSEKCSYQNKIQNRACLNLQQHTEILYC